MRRVIALCCGVAAAVMALTSAGKRAAAAEADDPRDIVEGTSACPEPRAVWSALRALAVSDTVERRLRGSPAGVPPVEVADLGAAFRVRAGDRAREYHDDSRDCDHRAKVAALFVALTADSVEEPAHVTASEETAPPPAPVPAVAHREPAPAAPPARVAHLEVGADARFGVSASTTAPGALARICWGRGRFALAAGARGSAPADATIAGVRVRQWRLAAHLAVRARFLEGRAVTPFLELGAVAALLSESARDLAVGRAGTAGELGFVAGGGAGFLRRSWGSAFVLVEAEVDPDPPALSVLPTGSVGRTPYVWLGAAAGLSLGLF